MVIAIGIDEAGTDPLRSSGSGRLLGRHFADRRRTISTLDYYLGVVGHLIQEGSYVVGIKDMVGLLLCEWNLINRGALTKGEQ